MSNLVAPKYDNLFGNSTPVVNYDPNVIQTSYPQPTSSSGMIGGILQGVSSLFNSFASIGAGKRQARRQKEVAEHNYNLQMQAYERQLADQERLTAEEREYNDFSSVARRAREAGFNPNAVVGTASGGNVSTSTPSLDAPQMEAYPIDPLMQVGSSIQSAINAYQQAEMVSEQIKAQKLANADAEAELKDKDRRKAHEIAMDDYAEVQAQLNSAGTQLDNALKSLAQQSATEDLDIKRQTKQNVIKLAEANLKLAEDAHKENENQLRKEEIELSVYDKRLKTEIKQMNASIYALYKNAEINHKAVDNSFVTSLLQLGIERNSLQWKKSMDLKNYVLELMNTVRSQEEFNLKLQEFAHQKMLDEKFNWTSIWGVLSSLGNAMKINPGVKFGYTLYENAGSYAGDVANSITR